MFGTGAKDYQNRHQHDGCGRQNIGAYVRIYQICAGIYLL